MGPDEVDGFSLTGTRIAPAFSQACAKSLDLVDRLQAGIVSKFGTRLERVRSTLRWFLDEMARCEGADRLARAPARCSGRRRRSKLHRRARWRCRPNRQSPSARRGVPPRAGNIRSGGYRIGAPGTSRPRLANSARSAATRGALSARSLRSSNHWKWASNMRAIYEAGTPSGNVGPRLLAADQDQRGPAVEIDPPFEREAAIGGDGGVGLGRQQAGENDAAARGGTIGSVASRGAAMAAARCWRRRDRTARGPRILRAITPSAFMTSTKLPAWLKPALAWAACTALPSTSVASTRCRKARAAATASTPEPVPRSRILNFLPLKGGERRASASRVGVRTDCTDPHPILALLGCPPPCRGRNKLARVVVCSTLCQAN